jgi:putative methylase
MSRAELARRLSSVSDFENPDAALEQYSTPPELAAHLVHRAALQGDIAGENVVDLGTGTGVLALAAACRGPDRVIGLDVDEAVLDIAVANERTVDPNAPVSWLRGDATRPPIAGRATGSDSRERTVLMNPPFGAQRGNEHADRAFLAVTAAIADVSYSIHNAGSRSFVEEYAADNGGEVTHAFAAELPLENQFEFHDSERENIDVELFRVTW